ncbi:MAG TPA: hypothetical protein VGP30_05920 [Candidatus Limnocylindrales bacterium]|nr:hypothetical protein [Candidatus Limnocylindrales bacterium]
MLDGPARPTLVPVSFGTMFEITGRLVRRHLRLLLVLAAVFLLIPALVGAVAWIVLFDALLPYLPDPNGARAAVTLAQGEDLVRASLIFVAAALLEAVASALAAVAFSRVVATDYAARRPGFREAAVTVARRGPAAVGAILLSLGATIAIGLGGATIALAIISASGTDARGGGLGVFLALIVVVSCVAVAIVLSVRWSLALVAVAVERMGPLGALIRSWRLTAGAAWRTFGVVVVATLITAVLGGLVSELLGLTLADLVFGEASEQALAMRTGISAVVAIAFAPILPVAVTVLYFDRRVRAEGDAALP